MFAFIVRLGFEDWSGGYRSTYNVSWSDLLIELPTMGKFNLNVVEVVLGAGT